MPTKYGRLFRLAPRRRQHLRSRDQARAGLDPEPRTDRHFGHHSWGACARKERRYSTCRRCRNRILFHWYERGTGVLEKGHQYKVVKRLSYQNKALRARNEMEQTRMFECNPVKHHCEFPMTFDILYLFIYLLLRIRLTLMYIIIFMRINFNSCIIEHAACYYIFCFLGHLNNLSKMGSPE